MLDKRKLYETDKRTKDQVFRILKNRIFGGEYFDGEQMPSAEMLAASLRTDPETARQALAELADWGFAEESSAGYYVRTKDLDAAWSTKAPEEYHGADLIQVMQFRRAIETETAAIAASCAEKEDVAMLHKAAMDMVGAVDWTERMMADRDFHYKIAIITKNPLIIRTYDMVWDILRVNMIETAGKAGNDMDIYYHSRIIAAIGSHNEEDAARLMREHLTGPIATANLLLHAGEQEAKGK